MYVEWAQTRTRSLDTEKRTATVDSRLRYCRLKVDRCFSVQFVVNSLSLPWHLKPAHPVCVSMVFILYASLAVLSTSEYVCLYLVDNRKGGDDARNRRERERPRGILRRSVRRAVGGRDARNCLLKGELLRTAAAMRLRAPLTSAVESVVLVSLPFLEGKGRKNSSACGAPATTYLAFVCTYQK